MNFSNASGKGIKRLVASALLLFVLIVQTSGVESQKLFLPLFTYTIYSDKGAALLFGNSLVSILPLCNYSRQSIGSTFIGNDAESQMEAALISEEENAEELGEEQTADRKSVNEVKPQQMISASGELPEDAMIQEAMSLNDLLIQENAANNPFVPGSKVASYDWSLMSDYETLISTFYVIDKYALAGSDLFNVESLLNKDLSISKENPSPQILIYHTHSKETFIDSVPGDSSQSIVGVGDFLTNILTEQYGYGVLHHTVEYDTIRDEAYAKSLPAIEKLLQENPSIQVVIDLHRDSALQGRDMVVDVNGRKTARFMFFNGISRSKKTGSIDYLENPNLMENLAFSFQMQAAAGEYYPGLTRKIYIKQYRYNMHLCGKTLLIELGDESNTVEEAKNACYPIAHLIDVVLSGTAR
ncbi:MAG TPA: stage II sporulation protein P [Lachnospiraceae bacterium]|nr:stage II sporulation protein P [Lachnospiraceae bacterium]